jgi:hypothetical protein
MIWNANFNAVSSFPWVVYWIRIPFKNNSNADMFGQVHYGIELLERTNALRPFTGRT